MLHYNNNTHVLCMYIYYTISCDWIYRIWLHGSFITSKTLCHTTEPFSEGCLFQSDIRTNFFSCYVALLICTFPVLYCQCMLYRKYNTFVFHAKSYNYYHIMYIYGNQETLLYQRLVHHSILHRSENYWELSLSCSPVAMQRFIIALWHVFMLWKQWEIWKPLDEWNVG